MGIAFDQDIALRGTLLDWETNSTIPLMVLEIQLNSPFRHEAHIQVPPLLGKSSSCNAETSQLARKKGKAEVTSNK
jgi:hypothetical protein